MSTRLYLPSSGSAGATTIAPSSEWDQVEATPSRRPLVTAKSNTALTNKVITEDATATTNRDLLFAQFVSEQLTAQTIDGTVKAVLSATESSASMNAFLRIVIRVIKADGTERGILFDSTDTTEVATVGARNQELSSTTSIGAHNTRLLPAQTLSSVVAVAGDRLVVEIGLRAHNSLTAQYDGRIWFGDPTATTDYAETPSLTTVGVGWIEFSDTITFAAIADPPSGDVVESGARIYDLSNWVPGEGGALTMTGTQLTSDPSVVITQSPAKVFTITYDTPVLLPIDLRFRVAETGGATVDVFRTIRTGAAYQRLVLIGGAWV